MDTKTNQTPHKQRQRQEEVAPTYKKENDNILPYSDKLTDYDIWMFWSTKHLIEYFCFNRQDNKKS